MSSRRVITAIAFLTILAGGVSAAVYSIPDVAIEESSSGSTMLYVSDGTDQAAININIRFDDSVATPGTASVGGAATGFTIQQNILSDVSGSTDELRIVVYQNPTATFAAGRDVVVQIPWTAVAAAPAATPLTIDVLGVSNASGVSVAGTSVSGLLSIINAGGIPSAPIAGIGELSQWTSFGVGFPLNDAGALPPTPGGGGTAGPLTITTDADHDGLGGWGSGALRFNYQANSVYRVDWTLSADSNGGTALNTFRLFVNEDSENAQAEVTVNPSSVGALAADGAARTYSVFYEPSLNDLTDLSDGTIPLGMALVMDVVDFGTNTEAGILSIENVTVTRFDLDDVNSVFSSHYAVADFSDGNTWTVGDNLSGYPANPEFGSFPLDPLQNYLTQTNYVQAGTAGTPVDAGGLGSIGFYQEMGLRPDVTTYGEAGIYRQVVNALTPSGSDPNLTATIRMRLFDEALSYSTAYFVRSGPEHSFADPGNDWFAVNRPPAESTSQVATYHNYLAYPAGSDLSSLIASGADSLLAVAALFDLSDAAMGDIRITDFAIERAPAEALLP